ncbi:MAG: TFIIB-type zinc ribbon-containing protein [Archaeoglobaceae archaeon]|nr:TFIIB-type zinc ribbon-containing protein [Archaeoglobales archaeon]MDI9643373.1 TFIIB-type zinc ribbon-containing protein [Archaeoglobales archaeon]
MRKLLVCPVCYSKDVELDTGGVSGKFCCKNCGYIGSFILEMTEGELEEMLKAKEKDFDKREF